MKESQACRRRYRCHDRQQSQSDSQKSFIDRDHWWWLVDHRTPWKTGILFELCNLPGKQSTDCAPIISLQDIIASSLSITRPERFLRLKAPWMMGRPRYFGKEQKNHKTEPIICSVMFSIAFLKRTGNHLPKEVNT